MSQTGNASNARDGSTERRTFHTNIRIEPIVDGQWRATEPEAESDTYGQGETPIAAVEDYARVLRDGGEE